MAMVLWRWGRYFVLKELFNPNVIKRCALEVIVHWTVLRKNARRLSRLDFRRRFFRRWRRGFFVNAELFGEFEKS